MARRFTAQRREQILRMLGDTGYVSASYAAQELGVSTETIRKDLIELDHQGLIKKSRGGAIAAGTPAEVPFDQKRERFSTEKDLIAEAALAHVPAGGTVIIDAGSTTYALAKAITRMHGLTIFTNSARALVTLAASNNEVFFLGGKIHSSSMASVGGWALNQLAGVNADVVFLGADSIGGTGGPTTDSYEEVAIKRQMVASSRERILLADSSKLTTAASFQFCSWENIELLIMNGVASDPQYDELSRIVSIELAG